MTTILSVFAVFISLVVAVVGYSQLRIASSKIKLDLYNKRFHIYETVLELFQELHHFEEEKIRKLELELVRCVRESKFLFDKKDGIYDLIQKIHKCNFKNSAYHRELAREKEDNNKLLNIMAKGAREACQEYEKHLSELEEKLEKYIQFTSRNGWSLK